uniref:Uncharacterized protein n=1 Tax=Brassica oleracea var. oleracea TaxID=109376 RepID=A0A0D3BVW6_BRAOL
MAFCAAAAIRHSTRRRPKMSQIVRALEGDTSIEDLSKGGRARENRVGLEMPLGEPKSSLIGGESRGSLLEGSEREKRIKRCGSSGSTVADLVDQTLRI